MNFLFKGFYLYKKRDSYSIEYYKYKSNSNKYSIYGNLLYLILYH